MKQVFSRYEIKYLLTPEKFSIALDEILKWTRPDKYGEETIQSLYYDTDNWLLIRRSIEKPTYKEKLRARSYGLATPDKLVYLELKKKYDKVVYKRRISLPEKELSTKVNIPLNDNMSQVEKEIAYCSSYYGGLKPKMLLLYDRTVYLGENGLRITFDKNIRYRTERLSLCSDLNGTLLLTGGEVMMEIKTSGAYPEWLVGLLNGNQIYKTSFSKYGTAYKLEIKKRLTNEKEAV